MNKCGMLPLAVKSIASLLRHEGEEQSWRDILESEIWESNARNEIFPPLQISYARLPTYLKSCFLYCSMFPKDYFYDVGYLVKLWMYQGFIESKGNKTAENIGFEYVQQLCQRSFFEREGIYEEIDFVCTKFKLHDIVHDLARLNSENGFYSIEASKHPIFPNVLYHLYIDNSVNLIDPITTDKLTTLRTLISNLPVKNIFSFIDLSMAPKLRALEIRGFIDCDLESLSSVGTLKHLRFLSLSGLFSKMLPECICSLYSLQNLTLMFNHLEELPTQIGNLISLEELIIKLCYDLTVLPESLCQLKALRKLFISNCNIIKELPNNIGNLVSLEELRIENCSSLQVLPESLCQLKALKNLCLFWCPQLKELPSDMGSITNLQTLEIKHTGINYLPPSLSKFVGIPALKVKLECETMGWLKDFPYLGGTLCLSWKECYYHDIDGIVLELIIKSGQSIFLKDQSCFSEISKLQIVGYPGITFPECIGSLCKLKYLNITFCENLQFLKAESLPLQLEELEIDWCDQLVSIPGIQKLKSLVKLSIVDCANLCSFMGPSLELTMCTGEGSYGSSLLGLTNLSSLRSLQILNCLKLQVLAEELLPVEPCKVEVSNCPGLKEWCLQLGTNYKDGPIH